MMKSIVEEKLAEGHDKKNYRCKGKRKTTIKEVEYSGGYHQPYVRSED